MPSNRLKKRSEAKPRMRHQPVFTFAVILFLPEFFRMELPLPAQLERLMRGLITSRPQRTELHLWLVGPGGCATTAYLIWRLLREFGRFLRVVVPSQAWSAATLLALGCDEIVLGPSSCLGPLDPQFEHPERNEGVCGLDIINAPEIFGQQAAGFLTKIAGAVPGAGEAPIHQSFRLAADLYQRTLDKTDPLLGAQVQRAVDQLIRYLTEMFAGRVCATPEGFDGAKLADHFVNGFHTHLDAIPRDHLRALELPVANLEAYEYRNELWEAYGNWLDRKNVAEPLIEVRRLDG